MNPVNNKSVIIIGAGITGCMTAYFLAKEGYAVRVFDRSGIGEKATRHNPGGINPLHGPGIPGLLSEFALGSYRRHLSLQPEIRANSAIDFEGRLVSRLELAYTEDEVGELERAEELYNQTAGFSAEWVDAASLDLGEARLAPGVLRALMTHGNGMVNSHSYALAIAECAANLGVEFVHKKVSGVAHSHGHATGVLTEDGILECEHMIFATGAWFHEPSEWLGVHLPVEPLKGQLLLARWPWGRLPFHIMRGMVGIYETPSGEVWMGGTQEDVGFDEMPTQAGRDMILQSLRTFFPNIAEIDIVDQVAGFRPVTPDRLPVVGKVPNHENVYIASGGGVKGILLSAGMAESLTALIKGKTMPYSLTQFSPNRFYK